MHDETRQVATSTLTQPVLCMAEAQICIIFLVPPIFDKFCDSLIMMIALCHLHNLNLVFELVRTFINILEKNNFQRRIQLKNKSKI